MAGGAATCYNWNRDSVPREEYGIEIPFVKGKSGSLSLQEQFRPQRADARRNRERVLEAARELFAEEGAKVQIEQVANRAGVGVGTVCRNFPTKWDLMDAVITQNCETLLAEARAALDEADAGAALRSYFLKMSEFQASHRALAESMAADQETPSAPTTLKPVKVALQEVVGQLMARAQAAGAIRPDIGPGDITMLFSAIGHATAHTCDPQMRDRYVSIVLDGLRPLDASPLPGRPLDYHEIQKASRAR